MSHWKRIVGACAAAGLVLGAATVLAQGSSLIGYVPPKRGAPSSASRVGGGTRGRDVERAALTVLAPTHVGYTVNAQPNLYWFIADRVSDAVEIVVVDETGENPLLDVSLAPPHEPGVHEVSLAARGVTLEPDRVYQWFAVIVRDPDRRSLDVISGGDIVRVDAPAGLRAGSESVEPLGAARAYAEAGIWYDMLASLAVGVADRTKARESLVQRAALLEQVGLTRAAAFDRQGEPSVE